VEPTPNTSATQPDPSACRGCWWGKVAFGLSLLLMGAAAGYLMGKNCGPRRMMACPVAMAVPPSASAQK
jgi:hypothetical protein